MRKLWIVGMLLLLIGCSSDISDIGDEVPEASLEDMDLSAGVHQASLPLPVGGSFVFSYAVPSPAPEPGDSIPLIIALHFAGGNGNDYLVNLAEPGLRDLGGIIVAPNVLGTVWTNFLSENSVMGFIALAIEDWPIDPDRVVVTGYSDGGIGTWYLTDRHPEVFSAGIPMASPPVGSLEQRGPLFVIHGAQDELFNVQTTIQAVDILRSNGTIVELRVPEALSHYEAYSYVETLREAVPWLQETIWQ